MKNGSENTQIFEKYSKAFLGKIGKVEGAMTSSMAPRRLKVEQITGSWEADADRLRRFGLDQTNTALLVLISMPSEVSTDTQVVLPRVFEGIPVHYKKLL